MARRIAAVGFVTVSLRRSTRSSRGGSSDPPAVRPIFPAKLKPPPTIRQTFHSKPPVYPAPIAIARPPQSPVHLAAFPQSARAIPHPARLSKLTNRFPPIAAIPEKFVPLKPPVRSRSTPAP